MMSQNDDNNVIEFPGVKKHEETKAEGQVIPFPVEEARVKSSSFEEQTDRSNVLSATRKLQLMVALFAVIFSVTTLNSILYDKEGTTHKQVVKGSRSLASVGSVKSERNSNWENRMAEDLSQTEYRELASLGRSPTEEEKLRFGLLEGKYALQFSPEGHLKKASFQDGNIETPTVIKDRKQFLLEAKALLPVRFERAQSVSKSIKGDRVTEVYELRSSQGVSARVEFQLDQHERLLSVTVQ